MPAAAHALSDVQPWGNPGRAARERQPANLPALPNDIAPQLVQAIGARVWSADGAEYVDFDNTGGAVLLGHRDPAVVAAVRLARADSDSWAVEKIRAEVRARILGMVPWAEAAVFGADVCQALRAAMTCARLATGRPQVLVCRSSAWRSGAQPPTFPFDDLPALERLMDAHGDQIAALVLSPCETQQPSPGYLAGVRALLDRTGALLIFDETLSGFRVHEGGAQALFGVRADLAVYGESLANGMPLGALVGSRALIETADAGELSADVAGLAAARAVLIKIDREPVICALRVGGAEIQAELARTLDSAGLQDIVQILGDPAASRIGFCPPPGVDGLALKALWVRECLSRNLFSLGALNMSYAHGQPEIAVLLAACEHAADRLALALRRGQFPRRRRSDSFQRLMVQ
jgi:glutamate-1-semialdehyde 2,1-aminomutase